MQPMDRMFSLPFTTTITTYYLLLTTKCKKGAKSLSVNALTGLFIRRFSIFSKSIPRPPPSVFPGAEKGLSRSLRVVFLLALVSGVAAAGDPPEEPQVWVDTERWTVELPVGSVLKVSNRLGDVRGRSSGNGKLLVVAIIQRFALEQGDADVSIVTKGGEVVVETRYPSAEIRGQDGRLQGRIDLSLLVPAGGRMEIETDHGLLEIKGISRDLVARTSSGRLRVTTGRTLTATTESGELRAVLKNATPSQPARLETKGGPLRVDLLDTPGLGIRARTGGEMTPPQGDSEKVQVARKDGISELRMGKSPWALQALSESGAIEIHAVPPNELR